MPATAPTALSCLALLCSLPKILSQYLEEVGSYEDRHQRLAVLLPTSERGRHDGQWPTRCSPGKSTQKVDLVLYVPQQGSLDVVGAHPPHPPKNHCFARVRTVYGPEANLGDSKSPSANMLYSAFLDKDIHSQLSEYAALAVIPSWDAIATATDFSVDTLYNLAFPQHDPEDNFWVKNLTLGGSTTNLRGGDSQSRGGEGTSIYNNDDLELAGFVRDTTELQHRQKQSREASASPSFDEALSLTLKEPQYEKYIPMFVTAGLTPASGDIDEGQVPFSAITTRKLQKWKENEKYKTLEKWMGDAENNIEPKWKAEKKWMGDPENGVLPKWQAEEKWATRYCAPECARTSNDGTKGRVCDSSCESGEPYGTNGCSAKNGVYGTFCRVCYNDVTKAQRNDSPGDRAIMCDTMEPPSVYSKRSLAAVEDYPNESASRATRRLTHFKEHHNETSRKLQKWRENEKYKTLEKWMGDAENNIEPKWKAEKKWIGDPENGVLPKWQAEEKWATRYCAPECARTSNDGTKGRVCDSSCESGEPYGTNGCSAKNGMYGMFCRVCYNDVTKAQRNDSPGDHAIMCDTMEPPSVYSKRSLAAVEDYPNEGAPRDTRRLTHLKERPHEQSASPNQTARKLQKWRENEKYKTLEKWMGDAENNIEPKWKAEKKWMGDPENGVLPKWQAEEKWATRYCALECARTSNDGTKGRVCDSSCESGEPYGTNGCSAKNGMYGMFCRVCYNDVTKAQRNDSPDDRAIMCDTMEPPSVYSSRGLAAAEEAPDSHLESASAASELAGKLLVFKRDHFRNTD